MIRTEDCINTDWPKTSQGYGRRMIAGRTWAAHRYAWFLAHGPIPAGLVVCHACDNPACVNVEHLWLGTPSQNTRDRHLKGRDATGDRNGSRTHPERRPRGPSMRHPRYGEGNGRSVVSASDVRVMRRRHEEGESAARIARDYGLNRTTVLRIVKRRYWPHV